MKRQIEFDFSKWGENGITITDQSGNNVLQVFRLKRNYSSLTYMIEVENIGVRVCDDDGFYEPTNRLIMFEETKPREIFVLEDNGKLWPPFYPTKDDAIRMSGSDSIRIVKFIEALEND